MLGIAISHRVLCNQSEFKNEKKKNAFVFLFLSTQHSSSDTEASEATGFSGKIRKKIGIGFFSRLCNKRKWKISQRDANLLKRRNRIALQMSSRGRRSIFSGKLNFTEKIEKSRESFQKKKKYKKENREALNTYVKREKQRYVIINNNN